MGKTRPSDTEDPAKSQRPRTIIKGVYVLRMLALVLLALNVILIYAILFSSKGVLGYHQQCMQVEELESKVRKLKEENTRLFRRVQGFKSDARAQERLIREKLGWVRDNELVIEFVPVKDKSASPVQK